MKNQEITVVYNWTAMPGKSEELKAIYRDVEAKMKANEPGALEVQCYFDEAANKLVVTDLFENADALGYHLSTTAAAHFPSLLQIAQPGPFLFLGEVPSEMQQAAVGMGLDATFSPGVFGFSRN
ncbi:MAG: antibiotic biosynthesis monooxygenase [Bacteroidota bacterium]